MAMRAVFGKLGAELVELEDWNCCGATAYTSIKETGASALSARTLALAEKAGNDVVAPCSACYYVLNRTRRSLAEQPELREHVGAALAGAELPMAMERLFCALGAAPVDFPPKVRCCGGMLVATFPEVAQELCRELTGWAGERRAGSPWEGGPPA